MSDHIVAWVDQLTAEALIQLFEAVDVWESLDERAELSTAEIQRIRAFMTYLKERLPRE
jgi:hypothetical protein